MSEETATGGCGTSFAGLLALLFIGLKLTGYINWSWWWVLSPLWISAIILTVLFIAVVIIAVLKD
jgi:hypothetical protein